MTYKYDANSIEQLSFREAVRKRVGMYLGSSDHTGVMASLLEIVNNATDEFLQKPSADLIVINVWEDKVSVRDYGRGIPVGANTKSEEVLISLLTENHSGAKFNNEAYGGKSRGLHGTGASATNLSSDWFEVTSYRDGYKWFMRFEEGVPLYNKAQRSDQLNEKDGTFIYYKPSQDVFKSEKVYFDFDEICEEMEEYSFFNKGITFRVKNMATGEVKEYFSKNGLLDYAKKEIKNPIHQTPVHETIVEGDTTMEIIAQWSSSQDHKIILFSNGGKNPDGGTPVTGIKTSLTNFFKKEKGLNPDVATEGLVVICSVSLANPEYDGQTKVKIKNAHLRGLAQRVMNLGLNNFKQDGEYDAVIDYLKRVSAAEVAAQKAREAVKTAHKKLSDSVLKKRVNPDKLKDARNLGKNATLYIVEGDSGAGSPNAARDPNIHGVLAIKGKMINPLTSKLHDVYNNDEVSLLMTALGVVPGQYNSKKLRYGKVVILTDADSDGGHIALLVLNIIQELIPELLREGRVFRQEVPTHIRQHKGKYIYYYDNQVVNEKGDLHLIKGIGQMNAEQLKDTVFSRQARLTNFDWNDETAELLRILMGADTEPRKDYVMNQIDFKEVAE